MAMRKAWGMLDKHEKYVFIMSVFWGLFALVVISSLPQEKVQAKPKAMTFTPSGGLTGPLTPLEYTQEDLDMMTQALYFESQKEPKECRRMVAHVIMTRKYDWAYPNTIAEVVWEKAQFSYTRDGKPERMTSIIEERKAREVAREVLGGYVVDNTEGALYYYNPYLANPVWKDDYEFVTQCGKHVFLKKRGNKEWYSRSKR